MIAIDSMLCTAVTVHKLKERAMNIQKNETGWRSFIELCYGVKTKADLNSLFHLFFTPEEISDLSGRMLIVEELLKGEKNQREISKENKVSISKITRGSNSLKQLDTGFRKRLENRFA